MAARVSFIACRGGSRAFSHHLDDQLVVLDGSQREAAPAILHGHGSVSFRSPATTRHRLPRPTPANAVAHRVLGVEDLLALIREALERGDDLLRAQGVKRSVSSATCYAPRPAAPL